MGLLAGILVAVLCLAFIFWPQKNLFSQAAKTRVDSLRERKAAIYDNLRDLNFEYLAGKHPEEDFQAQRTILEDEAATVVAEMDTLESQGIHATR